ncbi:MAG: type II 3-dehydroquinate dehydratase [Formosimonas sp.]
MTCHDRIFGEFMKHVLILNGPNLNLLGMREPEVYGAQTLDDINAHLTQVAAQLGVQVTFVQNNIEGELVNAIHAAREKIDAIIINPAAYTHTSVAIRDALAGVGIPFVEVHLSNVHRREAFRHHSYLSELAIGVICGLGAYGYEAALRFLLTTNR